MTTRPGEGERAAASGYRHQYLVGAEAILDTLYKGKLEWVRVADPEAGRVDDLQIGQPNRVDAYQIKWEQYPGSLTLRELIDGTKDEPSLIAQLADGWQRLRKRHPQCRVIVHLVTNKYASNSTAQAMPSTANPPSPYHLQAFLKQAWEPMQAHPGFDSSGPWSSVWKSVVDASGLSADEFAEFVTDCSLDFQTSTPVDDSDTTALVNLLFGTAAGPEKVVELNRDDLLHRLGWTHRFSSLFKHEFPSPQYLYRPIQQSVEVLETKLDELVSGYIGVYGPPGSGKSTFLTRTLHSLPIRLIRYYAYVPESQDPSTLRGESINFLHDVTLRLWELDFCRGERPDPFNRPAMIELLNKQLRELGEDYITSGTKNVILVDGLDHIQREQNPVRSLLADLPLPNEIPKGTFFILGSQTDELSGLPPQVRNSLQNDERRIVIEHLSPADVRAIAEHAVPALNEEERQKIFELSDGHPLALIYLLKQLKQTEHEDERRKLLQVAIPYQGDIETQYWMHWYGIREDDLLVHTLGLLSRIRGPIPITWMAGWVDNGMLRKLQRLFRQYFEDESKQNWTFFHNSFRLFLVERTAEPLPGRTFDQQNRSYHRELSDLYKASSQPWQWETLYHLFSAEEFEAVVQIAIPEWFFAQVQALRPLDAIQTDARLALQAAGRCRNVVALANLTLVGAALEQRAQILENIPLAGLLLSVGEVERATNFIRDGNRLRVNPREALKLSVELFKAGLESEGRRVFDLAEPLELLSGRTIPDDHTRPQDLFDLLRTWIQSATVFRGLEEVMQVVRRISIEPERRKQNSLEEASHEVQQWLILQGALASCKRNDWEGWRLLSDVLIQQNQLLQFFLFLRSAEAAQDLGQIERAQTLLQELLKRVQPNGLPFIDGDRRRFDAQLSVAELAFRLEDNESVAQAWIEQIPPIPLYDVSSNYRDEPSLHDLRFRYARLCFLFDTSKNPEALLKEAEFHTRFGTHIEEDEKQRYRQVARSIYCLARLWALGHRGKLLSPIVFLHEAGWILDLLGPGWLQWPMSFRSGESGTRTGILRDFVFAAGKHGEQVVTATRDELEARWTTSSEAGVWWVSLQRSLILAFVEVGVEQTWATRQLQRIEPIMLQGLDPYGKAEDCREQTEAWLAHGEFDSAKAEIQRMVMIARGVLSSDDPQLTVWIRWLRRVVELEPEQAVDRMCLMLRRLLSVSDTASGVSDAAEELLGLVFYWSPRRAIGLLKSLLEHRIVTHSSGVSRLLAESLNVQEPPTTVIGHLLADLVLPFSVGTHPNLTESLIKQTSNHLGREAALDVARYSVHRIRIDVTADDRQAWLEGIKAALEAIDYPPDEAGIQKSELEQHRNKTNETGIDRSLYLRSGQRLETDEVLASVQTVADFRRMIEEEDPNRTQYFLWDIVVDQLAAKITSVGELKEFEILIESRLNTKELSDSQLSRALVVLSKHCLSMRNVSEAWRLAGRALEVTNPSGWDPYWDGGVRHAALRQLITVDADRARELIVPKYAQDLSERFRYPGRLIFHFGEILSILSADVPLLDIWSAIEVYLDDLFFGVPVEPQPMFEALLETPVGGPQEDIPERALADLLTQYLDHPSYPVAQGAVRACAAALLAGSVAVATVIEEALQSNDQVAERALMVLDAVSLKDISILRPFRETLDKLCVSANFGIRLIASAIRSRVTNVPSTPLRVEREPQAIYAIALPELAIFRTGETVKRGIAPVQMGDPARMLSPLDIEVRIVAQASDLVEDNVLYRAAQLMRTFETQRTWLPGSNALDSQRLSTFLDSVGLRHKFLKPQIAPARHALSHVVAELYDGGYFPPEVLQWLPQMLVHHDPIFIVALPEQRPSWVAPIGGIPIEDRSYLRLTTAWVEEASNSFPLLHARTPDDRIVLGEWTQLRHLDEQWPEEERVSTIRAVNAVDLWEGFDVKKGYRPFAGFQNVQIDDYLELHKPPDHLVITHHGYDHETSGAHWLALNPAVGRALGWQPVLGRWFRWANQEGTPVVESIWWKDGPVDSYNQHLHSEVGTGWLVLATQQGFEEIKHWRRNLSRGGVVRRSKGWYGDSGRHTSMSLLDLP
jgi:hypothetical protein